jgi:hypothetical protein
VCGEGSVNAGWFAGLGTGNSKCVLVGRRDLPS